MKLKMMFLILLSGVVSMAEPCMSVSAMSEMMETRDLISIEENKVLESLFIVNSISPGGNMLGYNFNAAVVPNMGLWELYLATYDYEKVPMSVADAGLEELGIVQKPDWAKAVFFDTPHSKGGNRSTSANLSYTPDMDISYGPGVLYYALKVHDGNKDIDNPEFYWVRGKISYRECAYNSMYGEPYMRMACTGKIRGNQYSYYRWRDPNDIYKVWGDDWGEVLALDLAGVGDEIKTWEGDKDELSNIKAELDRVEIVAEDATNVVKIRTEVEELRKLLACREEEIAQKETEEENRRLEEEEKKKQEEEEKRKEEANNKPGIYWPGAAVESGNKVDAEEKKIDNVDEAKDESVVSISKQILATKIQNTSEKLSDEDRENTKAQDVDSIVNKETAEVPILREEPEIKVREGILGRFWWVLLIIIGLLLGAIRRFGYIIRQRSRK